MSKALRPSNATVIFSYPNGIQFYHNDISPPNTVNFPMTVQRQSLN